MFNLLNLFISSSWFDLNPFQVIALDIWNLLLKECNKSENLNVFKRNLEIGAKKYQCRICQSYIQKPGYININWQNNNSLYLNLFL